MVSGDGRGILVESGLPIVRGSVWEMRKVKESRFFGLVLFLHVGGVHLLRLFDKDAIHMQFMQFRGMLSLVER